MIALSAHALHEECKQRGLQSEWNQLCESAIARYHEGVAEGVRTISGSFSLSPLDPRASITFEEALQKLSDALEGQGVILESISANDVYREWHMSQ